MRSLRNPLAAAVVISALMAACTSEKPQATSAPAPVSPAQPVQPESDYFPLATGNSWTFRCSAEGRRAFEKTIKVVADSESGGTRFFRTELTRGGDVTPTTYYMFKAADGTVFKAAGPSASDAEPVVRSAMKVGDKVGVFTAASVQKTTTPAITTEALRLENFPSEDPNVSADRRMEWLGRSYANGVGPLVEADGLGGECVLVKYQVAGQR